jgi:hypothetical protein
MKRLINLLFCRNSVSVLQYFTPLLFLMIYIVPSAFCEDRCVKWDIQLPKGLKIERAVFDSYLTRNLFIIGEGGNGVFLYDIPEKRLKQIYYSRVITDSIEQTSINTLKFELFYKKGISATLDIYQPQKMPSLSQIENICYTKNGRLNCSIDGQDVVVSPLLGQVAMYRFSKDSNLLLFSSKLSGGYVYGTKTKEIAKLGQGEDFKFVNDYDVIFVTNSRLNDRCTDSYIYYWLNSAIDTFIIYRSKDGCIRYPDANKTDLIFIKDNTIYRCPLDLMDAVMKK